MKGLKKLCNYFLYCGIEKDEYNAIKKDAYVSNFMIWRILHFLMAAAFGFLFITSLFSELLRINTIFYIVAFFYSVIAIVFFLYSEKRFNYCAAFNLSVYLNAVFVRMFSFSE